MEPRQHTVGGMKEKEEVMGVGGLRGDWTADRGPVSSSCPTERLQGDAVVWRGRAWACEWGQEKKDALRPNDGYETGGGCR